MGGYLLKSQTPNNLFADTKPKHQPNTYFIFVTTITTAITTTFSQVLKFSNEYVNETALILHKMCIVLCLKGTGLWGALYCQKSTVAQ